MIQNLAVAIADIAIARIERTARSRHGRARDAANHRSHGSANQSARYGARDAAGSEDRARFSA